MHVISLMGMVYPQGVLSSPFGAFIQEKSTQEIFRFNRKRSVDENVWRDLGAFLSDTLIDYVRDKCAHPQESYDVGINNISYFLNRLRDHFQISVVTVNYDNILYRSLGNITTGFNVFGRFEDRLLFDRDTWPCILHLHGSVHFKMISKKTDLHHITWEEDLSKINPGDSCGRGPILSTEGSMFPNSVIIAGYGKSIQMLRRPFRTYYSELDRLVSSSDALLCLGYGFGDMHLNLALGAYRDNRRKPFVIVDWAEDKHMSASASGVDGIRDTIGRALQLFDIGSHKMQAFDRFIYGTVKYLKDKKEFDVCTNPDEPLAIWYNGMYAACENPDRILRHLS